MSKDLSGELLNSTNHILNTIEEMGQTRRQHKRGTHSTVKSVHEPSESRHPWSPLIQQTKLLEQEVPAYFQEGSNLQTQYVNEEEVLQTTTCSTKDLQEDMEGWKKAFTKELDSFERLNVKTDVWENTLDLRNVEILPGKVVMVKKPIGDGTQLKKGRVVVCGNFQQVQPGEETCANTPSFPIVANVNFIGVIATMGSSVMGCFNCIPLCTIGRGSCCLLSSTERIDPFRTGKTRRGVEIE